MMTVNEIEATLQSLYKRHDNLNEAMLLTLLRAGGWDEKIIHEVVAVHRRLHVPQNSDASKAGETEAQDFFPELQFGPVFIPQADEAHLLEATYDHSNETNEQQDVPSLVSVKESVSPGIRPLEEPRSVVQSEGRRNEPPHNLPLKPFDVTPHIWSFEKYKSIFYGDAPEKSDSEKEKQPKQVEPIRQQEKVTQKEDSHEGASPTHHVVHVTPVPLDRDDERLVLLASTMLITILLLLGYMYSHGRL